MATKPKLTPAEQLARRKMRALSEGTRIWQLEAGPTPRYASPSSTGVGVAYEIICHNVESGDVSCNCKAAENGRSCEHLGAVFFHLDVSAETKLAQAEAAEDREKESAVSQDKERIEREVAELYS